MSTNGVYVISTLNTYRAQFVLILWERQMAG
jgi:hypothetical protein